MSQNLKITSYSEFVETIEALKRSCEKLKDIFQNERRMAEKVNGTETWTGSAQRAMYAKYIELNKNYEPIEYSLEIYIRFLEKTKQDYLLMNRAISKNIEAMEETLDVIS